MPPAAVNLLLPSSNAVSKKTGLCVYGPLRLRAAAAALDVHLLQMQCPRSRPGFAFMGFAFTGQGALHLSDIPHHIPTPLSHTSLSHRIPLLPRSRPAFRMGYAPRGFDRLVFLLIICCLPCVYGEGGFCWKYGSLGQNCDTVCTSVALVCVKKFDKVGSEDDFKAASGGGVGCESYYGTIGSYDPSKESYNGKVYCRYQKGSGGTCTKSDSDSTRLCSCQCAAGTSSTSDLKPYPCSK